MDEFTRARLRKVAKQYWVILQEHGLYEACKYASEHVRDSQLEDFKELVREVAE